MVTGPAIVAAAAKWLAARSVDAAEVAALAAIVAGVWIGWGLALALVVGGVLVLVYCALAEILEVWVWWRTARQPERRPPTIRSTEPGARSAAHD
jgi:hypothetical protein